METTNKRTHLTPQHRQQLKVAIDQAVRNRTTTPRSRACPECGADTRDLPAPVTGCDTCTDRFWHRQRRNAV